ncbi:hypothetical protein [Streptomyces sp. NRRL F-6492]|uniref:hypothetical protein n=1 Tax=Streptomyces sp. NRRL F-6492 TaxID=1519497 RepID=UPI0006ADEFFB|nr:hypothetical protein [Streptomyces sp. NRRL F-6492]
MSRTTISERGEARMPEDGAEGGTAGRGGPSRAPGAVALVVAAGAAALLSVGAFLGLYARPTSDDWCALWKARDMGVLGITSDFYLTQNGRVTNAFLTGLVYSDGMRGPKLLPAFLVVALGAALFLLAREALRALRLPFPAVATAAAVLVLEALLFFAGTRSYQVLLWAPATISHTLPSVIGLWAVLGAVRAARGGPRARTVSAGGALLAGTAVGMLSEPFALVGGVAAVAVGLMCLPRFGWTKDRYASTWCAAACLGLAAGLLLLSTSPGARWRRAQHPPEPLSAAEVGETFHDWWRVWQTVGGQWAYLGAVTAGVLLGLGTAFLGARARTRAGTRAPARTRPAAGPSRRPVLLVAALSPLPLIALASLAVVYGLRSGYGVTGWTYARTWTSFLVPLLPVLCAYGTGLGLLLGRRLTAPSDGAGPGGLLSPGAPAPRIAAARVAVLVAAGASTVVCVAALVSPVRDLTTATVARSLAWDRQDARIRSEAADGAREVAYRPLPIGRLAEPFFTTAYPRDWVAQCASRYYGVSRVTRS